MSIELFVEKLVVGGKGLARLENGLVVLVPYVIPGEKITVQLGEKKKSFQLASLLEVKEPSPDRIEPPCPYFGRCGGCHFQHVEACRQDILKKEIFFDELIRAGLQFDKDSIKYLPGSKRFGYRQRIRLHARNDSLGFYQPESHTFLEIDKCLLARKEINEFLKNLVSSAQWCQIAEHLAEVEIQVNPADGSCFLIVTMGRKPRARDLKILEKISTEITNLSTLLILTADGAQYTSFQPKKNNITYFLNVFPETDLTITLEPGGFCQVNEYQNQKMVTQVLDWLKGGTEKSILDLFCGVGNFSLPLANAGWSVVGVDQQRAAIRSAQKNNDINKLNCDFKRASAQEGLEGLLSQGRTFDAVVLDPPRAGFKKGSVLLPQLGASEIVYISCDQATLFRDLKVLCDRGYEISAITLVDQFCQSYHLESMVLLKQV